MFLLAKMLPSSAKSALARYKLHNMVARLFYTKLGQIFISALFGLAIAFMFQRVCKDRKCIVIHAPPMKNIEKKIFLVDDTCYQYTPFVVDCAKESSDENA
jgi:ABC-type uncharacterized transport system permease subunit